MAEGQERSGVAGSGPLYEHGEAGQKAADEPVKLPGSDDGNRSGGPPVGENQAAANREVDPPA
jgi:hypothetical protein